jgi:predicted nucleic acid-binding Zn ribbon protein
MKDDPLIACPNCGRPGLRRLLGGGGGMIFKGSGFYGTDYKSSEPKSKSTEEKKPEIKKDAPKETSVESKATPPPSTESKK